MNPKKFYSISLTTVFKVAKDKDNSIECINAVRNRNVKSDVYMKPNLFIPSHCSSYSENFKGMW